MEQSTTLTGQLELTLLSHPRIRDLRGVDQGPFQAFQGQALARLHVGASAFIGRAAALGMIEGLDRPHDFTAGSPGFEHLPDKTFEGQTQAENALAAVGAFFRGSQEPGRQQPPQFFQQGREIQMAQGLGSAPDLRAEAGAPGGKKGSVHLVQYYYWTN